MIILLGSIPAAGGMPLGSLGREALALFPEARAVLLQALPEQSESWQQRARWADRDGMFACLLAPWRQCHMMPVPASMDDYLGQFSAKKRYNIKRQLRLLSEAGGELSLTRIERASQVLEMRAALAEILPPLSMARVQRQATGEALAQRGLLLCYVMRAGQSVVAVIVGTRSQDALHIHRIHVDPPLRRLSAGTLAMHMAAEDVIRMACFRYIDFGYGSPRYDFNSSHIKEARAPVALVHAHSSWRHVLRAHGAFHHAVAQLAAVVKCLLAAARRLRGRMAVKP